MNNNRKLAAILPLLMFGGMHMPQMMGGSRTMFPAENKERKCLLRGCENMTTHNGGYCCAEHCKQDRRKS